MNRLILPLKNTIQNYAWGSRESLAAIRAEKAPSERPEAELWMGAHPAAPSIVTDDGERSLLELAEEDPDGTLGSEVREAYKGRFPFLLKILAAAEPLSLQAHPTKSRARDGFAREEAAGVARDAPNRNYRDENHKPELLCALTPFHALVGFRSLGATLKLFESLGVEALRPLAGALSERRVRRFFELAMAAKPERESLARETLDACRRLAGAGGEFSKELAWGVRIGEKYPGDPGLVVALALNLVELAPGEAVYLPPRNLHSYLEGTGVEIMASSDNVLRGGLTPKHVDVPELVKVVDFDPGDVALVPVETRGAEQRYQAPAPDFALSRFELAASSATVGPVNGPEIVVVTSGAVTVRRGTASHELASGASAFLPPRGGDYALDGTGTVFRARVNDTS